MKLLLDSHTLLWWLLDHPKLSPLARDAIQSARVVYVSAASAYELSYKRARGRLPEMAALSSDFAGFIGNNSLVPLAISIAHAEAAGRLHVTHRDPFDRLIVAQAIVDELVLVSNERRFDALATGLMRLW